MREKGTGIDERMRHLPGCGDLIRSALGGWLAAALVELLCLPPALRELSGRAFLSAPSGVRAILVFALVTLALLLGALCRQAIPYLRMSVTVLFAALSAVTLALAYSTPLLLGCLALLGLFVWWAVRGRQGGEEGSHLPPAGEHPAWLALTATLSLCLFVFLCAWGVGRVVSLSTPTYDMGIFSQMFHSMKESGGMVTTVEREATVSHMAVHVSPIYYLLLPAYCLFPRPETLAVLQALVLVSAVLPLWGLCGHHGLRGYERVLLCALFLLYPATGGGVSYDIHENCFLVPLLLWLLLGIEKKSLTLTALSAVLTLGVKEDAAVYVATIGLYLLLRGLLDRGWRDALSGAALLAVSLAYFFLVTAYLAEQGDGVMTWRYAPFMRQGESSLWEVIRTALLLPSKVVYQCLQADRLRYLALTLPPLLGLPLLTRRYEGLVLLIPYVLVNLMPDYTYQHDIFFQYSFGSLALLFYLTVCHLGELRGRRPRWLCPAALSAALAVSAVCFALNVLPRATPYLFPSQTERAQDARVRAVLDTVPDGAPAAATTFYTTYLCHREVLYDVGYSDLERLLSVEYIALQLDCTGDYARYATEGEDGFTALLVLLCREGYRVVGQVDNVMVLLCREGDLDRG